jgi:hypothetical protein
MPITAGTTTGGTIHPNPWVGEVEHRVSIRLDVSTLTSKEVDEDGYVKPGVPLVRTGALVSTNAEVIYGATVEATKIPGLDVNTDATLAAFTADFDIAVCVIGALNQDVLEDILGRALTANELLAFAAAGCLIKLY